MGRTLPLAAGSTDARDRPNDVPSSSALLEACTSPERRVVLETLCEAESVSLDALAERVVASRRDVATADVPEDAREQAAVGLYHNHLQQLSEVGVVEQSGDGVDTTVSLSADVEPERVHELIEFGEGNWATLEAILSDEQRRYATTVLSTVEGALSLEELAEAVAVLERGEPEHDDSELRESVRISLHHVHLPALEEADVVSYDADAGLVELDGLPEAYRSAVSGDSEAVSV